MKIPILHLEKYLKSVLLSTTRDKSVTNVPYCGTLDFSTKSVHSIAIFSIFALKYALKPPFYLNSTPYINCV